MARRRARDPRPALQVRHWSPRRLVRWPPRAVPRWCRVGSAVAADGSTAAAAVSLLPTLQLLCCCHLPYLTDSRWALSLCRNLRAC